MKRITILLVAAVVICVITTTPSVSQQGEGGAAPPRSAWEVRGNSPYWPVENQPPPKLVVDEPLADALKIGVALIQYRTENCRLVPVFGKEALVVSPRVGHLHIRVDDLPWVWADSSDNNTVDIGGMPPGEHKVTIDLVDSTHKLYPGQSRTVKFTVPASAAHPH
jgi:hypothetical protein